MNCKENEEMVCLKKCPSGKVRKENSHMCIKNPEKKEKKKKSKEKSSMSIKDEEFLKHAKNIFTNENVDEIKEDLVNLMIDLDYYVPTVPLLKKAMPSNLVKKVNPENLFRFIQRKRNELKKEELFKKYKEMESKISPALSVPKVVTPIPLESNAPKKKVVAPIPLEPSAPKKKVVAPIPLESNAPKKKVVAPIPLEPSAPKKKKRGPKPGMMKDLSIRSKIKKKVNVLKTLIKKDLHGINPDSLDADLIDSNDDLLLKNLHKAKKANVPKYIENKINVVIKMIQKSK